MPFSINPSATERTELERDMLKQATTKIAQRAEQIRRERTQQQQETTMPMSRTRAESTDNDRLDGIEKTVTDLAVEIERLKTRIARLEPDQPSKPGDDPNETEANNLWRASIEKHQASSRPGPGVTQ